MANDVPVTTSIGGSSKSSKDPTGWAATQAAMVDTTGLNIPNMTGMQSYAKLFQAIESDALHGTSGGALWGQIRPILIAHAQNYTKREVATKGWINKDASGLQAFLTGLHNTNAVNSTTPLSALAWIGQKANDIGTAGTTTFTPLRIQNINVPNTLDLKSIADTAFRSALGRPPTDVESSKFASSYQQQVMAVAGSNAQNAADVQQANDRILYGGTPSGTPTGTPSGTPSGTSTSQTVPPPAAPLNFKQDVPNATVAATNFARQTDPAGAASNGLNDAMNAWFATLNKGGGQ